MRTAVWVVLTLELVVVGGILLGAVRGGSGGDQAGRGMAQAYAAIAVTLAVLLLGPALLLQATGHTTSALVVTVVFTVLVVVLAALG